MNHGEDSGEDFFADTAQFFMACAMFCISYVMIVGAFTPWWANMSLCLMSPACFFLALIFSVAALFPVWHRQGQPFEPLVWDVARLPLAKIIEQDGKLFIRAEKLNQAFFWRPAPLLISVEELPWARDLGRRMPLASESGAFSLAGVAGQHRGLRVPAQMHIHGQVFEVDRMALAKERLGEIARGEIYFRGFIFKMSSSEPLSESAIWTPAAS